MAPPTQIGPYALGECIGRGGMGVVFRAQRPDLPRDVALKLILPGAVQSGVLERFWREAEALARVNHPGVVRIHELAHDPAGPYLVEELVEGELLSRVCQEGLEAGRAARILERLADGLSAVHAAGILHRDLKPSNVIVRPGDHPVLLDFGLARAVDAERLTLTGDLLGTPSYMAPEQARGGSAEMDARTDVYQLGALGYHLLAGEAPFTGPVYQVLASVLKGDSPTWPDAEPGLVAIVKRAMAADPTQRYPTAAAMRDDLTAYLGGEAAPGATSSASAPSRGPLLLSVILAVCALIGVIAVVALRSDPADDPAVRPSRRPTQTASRSPTPTSASTPPGVGPVWNLREGDRLRFETWTAETASGSTMRITIRHQCQVSVVARGVVRWASTIERVELELGVAGSDLMNQSYRSDRAKDRDSPFHVLAKGVGKQWSLLLELETGSVASVEGLAPIARAVGRLDPQAPGLTPMQRDLYAQVNRRTLTDAFVQRHLDSLLQLRANERIAWDRRAASYRLPLQRDAALALPSPRYAELSQRHHRFDLQGIARTSPGRVERSTLTQVLTTPFRVGGALVGSTVQWGFALVP